MTTRWGNEIRVLSVQVGGEVKAVRVIDGQEMYCEIADLVAQTAEDDVLLIEAYLQS